MKKLNILTSVFAALALFASCEDDRDSNPTIQEPTTFVLNTPANAPHNVYDLNLSKNIMLTCTQPDYGYPAIVTYTVQADLTNQWKEETEEAEASYLTLPTTTTSARIDVRPEELNKVIVKLAGWESESDYTGQPMSVYIRLFAHIGKNSFPIHSNAIEMKVIPYFTDISNAVPTTYYMLGDFIGDIPWGNPTMEAGKTYFPLSLIKGYAYDANTGKGEFSYTGYIPADKGFKIVAVPGAWDDQWGNASSEGCDNLVNDHNSSNIKMNAAGWYTVRLNTIDNKLSIQSAELESEPVEYNSITLSYGSESIELSKVTMEHSHMWYADITIAANCKAKFTSGDKTWGGEIFPFGSCAENESISCKAGEYTVLFDDLGECYYFKAK